MSNSAPGLWLPNGGKGYGIVLGAPGDRRVVTRWCAFAPKVDSCAKPPAAWAITDLEALLRPVATCWLGRSDGAVADPCAACISDEKGHVRWVAGGGR